VDANKACDQNNTNKTEQFYPILLGIALLDPLLNIHIGDIHKGESPNIGALKPSLTRKHGITGASPDIRASPVKLKRHPFSGEETAFKLRNTGSQKEITVMNTGGAAGDTTQSRGPVHEKSAQTSAMRVTRRAEGPDGKCNAQKAIMQSKSKMNIRKHVSKAHVLICASHEYAFGAVLGTCCLKPTRLLNETILIIPATGAS
jgi:hypothetical protein